MESEGVLNSGSRRPAAPTRPLSLLDQLANQSSARPPSLCLASTPPPLSLSAFHSFALSLSILPPPHTFRSEEEAQRRDAARMKL